MLRRVDTEFSYLTAAQITREMGPLLCKSITHSTVASLAHSLTQSPLNSYYCYYCSKFDTYCDYCQMSPSQVYYALYYAGYYTSYLCGYYSEYEARNLEVYMKRDMEDIDNEDRERSNYDVLFNSASQSTAQQRDPAVITETFNTDFDPFFDGLGREFADPNAIPSTVFHPQEYIV
eukprot:CAMPEP_0197543788 /NCGR_PEP_ID=MMETSP1318-20131121/68428_1 /TAXON_ID=552666 /ORGANISM="Partenskyella glossopodia, Strain RCC365" /LENGTH=175 /DNA_ID=CAMNT_0043103151 /DNA_START=571 /DNA_END=1098 /DNA_ORIENTATION=-